MSAFTKSTYLSIFTTVVIFLVYALWVFQVLGVGYFTGPDALVRIGKALGTLILAGWAFHIIFVLGVTAFDLKKSGKHFADYRSMFIAMHVLCAGIYLAIGALAMGWAPFWVFNIIVLFYALANVTELAAKVFFIRQGIRT